MDKKKVAGMIIVGAIALMSYGMIKMGQIGGRGAGGEGIILITPTETGTQGGFGGGTKKTAEGGTTPIIYSFPPEPQINFPQIPQINLGNLLPLNIPQETSGQDDRILHHRTSIRGTGTQSIPKKSEVAQAYSRTPAEAPESVRTMLAHSILRGGGKYYSESKKTTPKSYQAHRTTPYRSYYRKGGKRWSGLHRSESKKSHRKISTPFRRYSYRRSLYRRYSYKKSLYRRSSYRRFSSRRR